MKVRYYHASPSRLQVGTVLTPQEGKDNFSMKGSLSSPMWGVFLTTHPVPHYTILFKALEEGWHVYEVMPKGEMVYGSCWDELICESAVVLKYVGSARGIYHTHQGTYLNNPKRLRKGEVVGSRVIRRHVSGKAKGTGSYRYVNRESQLFFKDVPEKLHLYYLVQHDVNLFKRISLYKRLGIKLSPHMENVLKQAVATWEYINGE